MNPLHPDDRDAFAAAVAGAEPLRWDRVHHEPTRPAPIPRHSRQDEAAALEESLRGSDLLDLRLEGGDEAAWKRPGVSSNQLRDLRRGRWVVQAHLDLHGMFRAEARSTVAEFLAECRGCGYRCLRIVHGKGLHSPGREPVLKTLVQGWLAQRREVIAFCQAPIADGGAGALLILLSA